PLLFSGEGRISSLYLLSLLMIYSCIEPQVKALKERPVIIFPESSTVIPPADSSFRITCRAQSSWPEFHIIYWLADNNFIEDLYPNGRVMEEPEIQKDEQTFCIVEKSLFFSSTLSGDFSSQFTCVIQDPSGVDVKNFTLKERADKTSSHIRSREEIQPLEEEQVHL
ncbi:hypothetical protein FKM82_009979, partial [Ascaphus truei]